MNVKPGGVAFIEMRHDDWCAARFTQRTLDCICNPDIVQVDRAAFERGLNREARRKAARDARRRSKR